MKVEMQDLRFALEADRLALGRKAAHPFVGLYSPDLVFRFQILMREIEYLEKFPDSQICRIRKLVKYRRYRKLSTLLGFSIPTGVFAPGLSIAHQGTIVVNRGACVGENCRLHVCVNIGTSAGSQHSAPVIGRNVYIGPGAKIFGPIEIADGCAIGANAVVNRSFKKEGSLIAGVPAKCIGEVDTSKMLVKATEQLSAR